MDWEQKEYAECSFKLGGAIGKNVRRVLELLGDGSDKRKPVQGLRLGPEEQLQSGCILESGLVIVSVSEMCSCLSAAAEYFSSFLTLWFSRKGCSATELMLPDSV